MVAVSTSANAQKIWLSYDVSK